MVFGRGSCLFSFPQLSLPMETTTHSVQHGHRPVASEQVPATLVPEQGWHFLHLFYRIDQDRLARFSAEDRQRARDELQRILGATIPADPSSSNASRYPATRPISASSRRAPT